MFAGIIELFSARLPKSVKFIAASLLFKVMMKEMDVGRKNRGGEMAKGFARKIHKEAEKQIVYG